MTRRHDNLRIDGARLWASLMAMHAIGATPRGGNDRQALTALDGEARALFRRWCEASGATVTVDALGNQTARRPGRRDDLPPVVVGSHLDTQPTGGKFDGVTGVLAGLELLRTLAAHDITTDHPIEVVNWTNEEGCRFAPAMLASGVYAGVYDQDWALARTDRDGVAFEDALDAIGARGAEACAPRPMKAFLELHIEQGPILEAEGLSIGVVIGAQGIRWLDVHLTGSESHAGTTPMDRRRDALVAAAAAVTGVRHLALARAGAVATVGELHVAPGARNTVPGAVRFTLDLRHPDDAALARLADDARRLVAEHAAGQGCGAEVTEVAHTPPVAFAPEVADAVRRAAADLGFPARDLVSGAGHDACHVARTAPAGMIFIPCRDGLSHHEEESCEAHEVEAGADVLLHAVLELARADG